VKVKILFVPLYLTDNTNQDTPVAAIEAFNAPVKTCGSETYRKLYNSVTLQEEIVSIDSASMLFATYNILRSTNMEPDNLLGMAMKLWLDDRTSIPVRARRHFPSS
jgi:hypothetical protein